MGDRKQIPAQGLVLYGASGHASMIRDHLEWAAPAAEVGAVVACIDDRRGDSGDWVRGVPLLSFDVWQRDWREHPVLIAVGDGGARQRLARRVLDAGGRFITLSAIQSGVAPGLRLGAGSWIGAQCYVAGSCVIGDHVHVQPQCLLSHDIVIGDFVTLCPGVKVAGHVEIRERAFVGIGAIVINGRPDEPLVIGAGAIVGAGSVVTESVPEGARVVGNPARVLPGSRRGPM